jgi:hypothetical protein
MHDNNFAKNLMAAVSIKGEFVPLEFHASLHAVPPDTASASLVNQSLPPIQKCSACRAKLSRCVNRPGGARLAEHECCTTAEPRKATGQRDTSGMHGVAPRSASWKARRRPSMTLPREFERLDFPNESHVLSSTTPLVTPNMCNSCGTGPAGESSPPVTPTLARPKPPIGWQGGLWSRVMQRSARRWGFPLIKFQNKSIAEHYAASFRNPPPSTFAS